MLPHTEHVIALCQQWYSTIPSFHLAQQARSAQQQFGYEYIYGEIDFSSFALLLERCQINSESVFYDLGSGAGKAVVCAALLYEFKKVYGIEQLSLLHECAQKICSQLSVTHSQTITLYQADLLSFTYQDADIVFINASAFLGDFWQAVLVKLQGLKAGTQIILVSKPLPEAQFEQVYSDFLPMSWGLARVGVYRVKLDFPPFTKGANSQLDRKSGKEY